MEAPVHVVPIRTAELVKYADNAFHAVKITFANEVPASGGASGSTDVSSCGSWSPMIASMSLPPTSVRVTPLGVLLPKDLRAFADQARKADVEYAR